MRNAIAIARRELGAYFASPIAYVVTAAMLALFGYFFYLTLVLSKQASLRPLFGGYIIIVLIFIMPLLTMRLLAEEQRSGTIELLLTSPVQDWEVIVGKYLAALALYVLMLVPTLYYPIVLEIFGTPDWGPIFTIYFGLILLGGALASLGTFTSALTSNQIVAAVLGVGLILILWLLPAAGGLVGQPLGGVLLYLGLSTHFTDFTKGVIDTKDIVYYMSVIAGALFLATRALETRRWR